MQNQARKDATDTTSLQLSKYCVCRRYSALACDLFLMIGAIEIGATKVALLLVWSATPMTSHQQQFAFHGQARFLVLTAVGDLI